MAIVASGSLAGVELTLAQELQYVLDKTPLQAGLFMVPIMAAAALGGPVAGWLSGRFGLRPVACLSLAISAVALAMLAITDFHDPGLIVPLLLAVLGLALSIGLTASSIAIMGAADASEAGAAGSLEATGYELGSGLGITLFGVFMSVVFGHNLVLPEGLPDSLAERASHSMGDVYITAQQLEADDGAAMIAAGKAAFSATHSVLLTTAAVLMAMLTILVNVLLRQTRSVSVGHH
ncbi:MFS transporter [Sagittula sp. NFXS13]|uniref:MFS transporter n=1 Tax=Sagittula sp. NFXS13 TaxID=2819095 RepID=UPI0032DF8CEB